ncbi:MAG: glycosyl transferase [Candidatus Saccharibacteria bacterium]|nr:glycosyl transferase [Candidatus Saccharibacteria bacterium]
MAKVDILLTYWGDLDLLKEAVNSVIAQTEDDWRLLIFDDCYPSKEPAIYFSTLTDDRIVYYRHKKNIGITKNFNFALKATKADYCVLLGCDDVLLPTYLETALAHVGDADMYQPSVDVIDGQSKVYLPLGDRIKRLLQPRKNGIYSGEKLAASLCTGNWLYFPSIMWKTKTIKKYGFDTKYKITEDVILELDIIKNGGVLFFDTSTTFHYRRFANSLSSKEKSKDGIRFKEETDTYTHFTEAFKDMGWKRASRAAKWHITSRLHRMIS